VWDCQSRIDLYTSITLPLQGIMVYNTGLNNAYSKVREMSHKPSIRQIYV